MKIKTHELTGPELDWAVAKCEYGLAKAGSFLDGVIAHPEFSRYRPSLNWAQGGPIIEREGIELFPSRNQEGLVVKWLAYKDDPESNSGTYSADGTTTLVAAMRCYVAITLGEEVEVPENLFSQL